MVNDDLIRLLEAQDRLNRRLDFGIDKLRLELATIRGILYLVCAVVSALLVHAWLVR